MIKYPLKTLFSICFAVVGLTLGAQPDGSSYYQRGATYLENILPPSPEAATAVKYADVPFTHSMGIAELDIPLYTLQGRELEIPIALSYRSGGIKLDEVAGVAGLGWSLEAGGCITRTVVDMPDEFSGAGFEHGMPSGTLLTNLQSQTNTTATMNYLRDVSWHRKDSALDRYSYNVCGMSGSFVIQDDGTVFYLSGDGVLITPSFGNDGVVNSFTLVGPDGTVYVLDVLETGIHKGRYTPPTPHGGQQDDWTATTAWYLRTVTSASGLETATFNYTDGGTWICDICPTTRIATFICDGITAQGTISTDSGGIQHRYNTKKLSSISLSGFLASFSYSSSTGYCYHTTATSLDRLPNYPQRLTGLTVSYDGTPLRTLEVGTGQDSIDGRITLQSLRFYAGGILDDKWDFSYATLSNTTAVSRYSQDWYGYYNSENENVHIVVPPGVPFPEHTFRSTLCPYVMENSYGTPIVTLSYGEPNGVYAHYMSLVSADHDGSLTEWEWEGAAITWGNDTYTVGSRVKSITVKDNGSTPIRKRSFSYADAACRGPVLATPDMYLNVTAKIVAPTVPHPTNTEYRWTFTLHETPVVEGPSIQNTRVFYGSVTEEETDGIALHGAKTEYTYDTSYATPVGTSNISRFPTDWYSYYNGGQGASAPSSISPLWGVRDVYQESGPEAPPLLTRKDIYKYGKNQHVLAERENYTYATLPRNSVLVDYRATVVMERLLVGDVRYRDIYHYPIWATDYAGIQPSNVEHITYGSGSNHTTATTFLYASRPDLSTPIRVSQQLKNTSGRLRIAEYTYPDTWDPSTRPAWAALLAARHSLVEPLKQGFGQASSFPPGNTPQIFPLEVVSEYDTVSVGGVTRLMPKKRIERRDGNLSWSEEVLARDCLGNVSSIKEKGKPATSIQWSYNGLYPVAIVENTTSPVLGSQSLADALTTAAVPTVMQLGNLNLLRQYPSHTHIHTFTHAPGKGLTSRTDPAGITTSYERDAAGRLTAEKDADNHSVKGYVYSLMNSGGHRSVRSRIFRSSNGNTYTEDVRWWNTLGLKQEDISIAASGNGEDLVSAYESDYLLHDDAKTWLPYPVQGSSGAFQTGAASASATYHGNDRAYSGKYYEESARNLIWHETLPGYMNASSFLRTTKSSWPKYSWNKTSGIKQSGTTTVIEERMVDADGRRRSTFKDGEGLVLGVSTGQFSAPATDPAPTYFVYDAMDRLLAVAGSGIARTDTLKMWRYGYDALGRLASKGIPGCAREWYGYDGENRLVSVTRPDGSVREMRYDAMNRVDSVLFTPSGGIQALLEENVYDSETAEGTSLMLSGGELPTYSGPAKGLEMYERTALLDGDGSVAGYARTAVRYDAKARPLVTVTQWPDSSVLKRKFTYNFPGEVTSDVTTHTRGADTDILSLSHTYDIRGRVKKTITTLTHNNVLAAADTTVFTYDDLGRPLRTTSSSGGASAFKSAGAYTLQGFQEMQSAVLGVDSLYVERLSYDNPAAVTGLTGTAASYSGFITGKAESWPGANAGAGYSRAEGYLYDNAGRLIGVLRSGGTDQYTYDNRGNILSAPGKTYSYSGDRLSSLTDATPATYSFQHDALGRITADGLDGTLISYNTLDLPRKISSSNGGVLVNYSYLADGSKASALKGDGTGLVYRGSLIYRRAADGTLTLESAPLPGGRITPNGARYHVTDHLGSVVAVVDGGTGAIYQASEYAPYGERTANTAVSVSPVPAGETLRDHFTGKEDQSPDFGLSYLDFGARHYSPAIHRWLVPDPIGEKYYDVSPYAYCAGNPVMMVDSTGRSFGAPIKALKALRKAYKTGKAAKKITAGALLASEVYGYYDDAVTLTSSESSWVEKGIAIFDVATGLGSEAKMAMRAVGLGDMLETTFRSFTARNFRHNLGQLTGGIPDGMQAHHMLPKKFRYYFEGIGINIDDPKYGAWLDASVHNSTQRAYNQEWEVFFSNNADPSVEDIENKMRELMNTMYGIYMQ